MNPFDLTFDFLVHRISAMSDGNANPFIRDFKYHILIKRQSFPEFDSIEKTRSRLLKDKTVVATLDFGAGSRSLSPKRTIRQITRVSSVNAAYGRLLYRLANHYKPSQIVEFGTAAGISTLYLASGHTKAEVITVEGNTQLARLAAYNFRDAGLKNITILNSTFDDVLSELNLKLANDCLIFIDGNHTHEATMRYFSVLSASKEKNPIFVFDDINWSAGMQSAWKLIRQRASGGIIIDLFYMGIYFCNLSSPLQIIRMNY